MKTIALILLFGFGGAAAAGYKEAEGKLKDMEVPRLAEVSKELDGLLAKTGKELAGDARAAALLAENREAMELFRQAAEEPSDGYLLAPKVEKHTLKTPVPVFSPHIKLNKLLLLDAKIRYAFRQNGQAEKDLLGAAGFLAHLSGQKSWMLFSSLVQHLWMRKSGPGLAESLVSSPSPAYLNELAARLDKVLKNQDFMRAAILQEAEKAKSFIRESVTSETMEAEWSKKSFLSRIGAKKIMDQEFFSKVYADFDAGVDAHARVFIGVFRANEPAPAADFMKQRKEAFAARMKTREGHGTFSAVLDGLKGGPRAKKEMAELLVDNFLHGSTPSYEKILPLYHLYLSELNVLRAALAVKLYQKRYKRLPENLDQLVPVFLSSAPPDPFNRFRPLVYARKGKKFLVYGFGPDRKDGSGAVLLDREAYAEDPARDSGDIVFAD